jgi:hypothetical protein
MGDNNFEDHDPSVTDPASYKRLDFGVVTIFTIVCVCIVLFVILMMVISTYLVDNKMSSKPYDYSSHDIQNYDDGSCKIRLQGQLRSVSQDVVLQYLQQVSNRIRSIEIQMGSSNNGIYNSSVSIYNALKAATGEESDIFMQKCFEYADESTGMYDKGNDRSDSKHSMETTNKLKDISAFIVGISRLLRDGEVYPNRLDMDQINHELAVIESDAMIMQSPDEVLCKKKINASLHTKIGSSMQINAIPWEKNTEDLYKSGGDDMQNEGYDTLDNYVNTRIRRGGISDVVKTGSRVTTACDQERYGGGFAL